jgi:hypothetical protein
VAHDRLSLTRDGRVAYALKTPYRDGTTHVILEPQDFVARPGPVVRGRYRQTTVRIRASRQEFPRCVMPAFVGDAVADARVTATVPSSVR